MNPTKFDPSKLTITVEQRERVLAYFKGKARDKAAGALHAINESLEKGAWLKGWSRKVRGALNKTDRVVRPIIALWTWAPTEDGDLDGLMWNMKHCLDYGQFERAQHQKVGVNKLPAALRPLASYFVGYRDAFAPVVQAMKTLDSMRPPPVITNLGVSPTVTKTLEALDAVKVECCPMHKEKWEREFLNKKTGKIEKEIVTVMVLDWPAGTKHSTSRFSAWKCQCEACGHGIRNPFNWIPLILTSKDGTPRSLWTGADCAHKLFGFKLTGELEIVDGPGATQLAAARESA